MHTHFVPYYNYNTIITIHTTIHNTIITIHKQMFIISYKFYKIYDMLCAFVPSRKQTDFKQL